MTVKDASGAYSACRKVRHPPRRAVADVRSLAAPWGELATHPLRTVQPGRYLDEMTAPDDLTWLTQWYLAQCDEDWEHEFGVTIDTLDNPGWSLSVDLDGTPLEGQAFAPLYDGVPEAEQPVQGGDGDVPWLVCRVEGSKFKAWGGPRDLGRMIRTFRSWAEA